MGSFYLFSDFFGLAKCDSPLLLHLHFFVKGWVTSVEIFGVQIVLSYPQSLGEEVNMKHF